MIYERIMKKYLEIDNNNDLPLSVRIYMLIYPSFRKEVNNMSKQLEIFKQDSPFKSRFDITGDIMIRIREIELDYDYSISSIKWLIGGSVIFASILLIPFSNSLTWLKTQFGSAIEVPIGLVLGAVITLYSCLYIGTHLEDLKKNMELRLKKPHWFD